MKELIKIETKGSSQVVSARELHKFLESAERFSKWFDRMKEYGFELNEDYTPYFLVHPQNKQENEDYAITLDCAKQIAMLQRNEKGREARQYFIACEKELKAVKKLKNAVPSPRLMRRISPVQLADMLFNCCFVEAKEVREQLAKQLYADTLCSKAGKKGGVVC